MYLLATLFFVVTPTFAKGPTSTPVRPTVTTTTGTIRSCQARESAVKTRMDQLHKLAVNMQEVFDGIATRVQTFYTEKVLPTGNTLTNYDALVADIATQKAAVTSTLNKTSTDVTDFNCTTDNPRTLLNQFRLDMQAVKSALKAYRTSIKNLIVAVHSALPEATPTP